MSLRKSVEKLHVEVTELTGRPERFMFHERSYAELLKFYSQDEPGVAALSADLRLLIRYLQRQIATGARNHGSLKIRNLLSPDRFDEDLAEARAFFTRRVRAPMPDQPKTVQVAHGVAVTRLDKAPDPEIPPTREMIQKTMAEFRRQMKGPRGQ